MQRSGRASWASAADTLGVVLPSLPPSSQVDLLPFDDPQWDWKAFERFCLGFVRAQSDVTDARLYGTRGQAQRGIDIAADLSDGRTRTYQCRKWQSYTNGNAESTVRETNFEADEHVILVGCEVGTAVRDFIAGLDGWSLLDKEDLSRAVREIEPRERARRLVEDTFTFVWRRAFLGPPGPLCFWETDDYFQVLLDQERLFRHTWEFVGRADLLAALSEQIAGGNARVLVLVGRGGIGKTRILRELAEGHKASRTVLFPDDQVPMSAESVEELPWTSPLVIVDDAHRQDDLGPLIGAARRREDPPTLLLATRPHQLEEVRLQLSVAGFAAEQVWVSDPLGDLPEGDVRSLAAQALGPDYEHLAEHLAAATADCPLVTVIGGQLLAQRMVPPELLERQADFRETVLDRFRDEMLGRLGDQGRCRCCSRDTHHHLGARPDLGREHAGYRADSRRHLNRAPRSSLGALPVGGCRCSDRPQSSAADRSRRTGRPHPAPRLRRHARTSHRPCRGAAQPLR